MEKTDYLEVDNPIPGQNYTCISFISPDIFHTSAIQCLWYTLFYHLYPTTLQRELEEYRRRV